MEAGAGTREGRAWCRQATASVWSHTAVLGPTTAPHRAIMLTGGIRAPLQGHQARRAPDSEGVGLNSEQLTMRMSTAWGLVPVALSTSSTHPNSTCGGGRWRAWFSCTHADAHAWVPDRLAAAPCRRQPCRSSTTVRASISCIHAPRCSHHVGLLARRLHADVGRLRHDGCRRMGQGGRTAGRSTHRRLMCSAA